MKFIDRPLAATVAVFFAGALAGGMTIILSPPIRNIFIMIIQVRILSPIQTVSRAGSIALVLLVFLNNSVPPVLSFLYPMVLTRINWTPPLTKKQIRALFAGYTYLSALLTGFFGIGATLGLAWVLEGTSTAIALLFTARVHAPLELFFVLVCLAEPLRLAEVDIRYVKAVLSKHCWLLWISLIGLFLSAVIEVIVLI